MCEAPICKCHCSVPKELKLEVGGQYRANNGKTVDIVSIHKPDGEAHPEYIGRMGPTEYYSYAEDGTRWGSGHNKISPTSLKEKIEKPEYRWFNYYPAGGFSLAYMNKASADRHATIGRLFQVRIDLKTGNVFKENI